jgi:hypothetical protein
MVSRPLIIVIAAAAGVYRIVTGAVLEGGGLVAMALGLVCLQFAKKQPVLKAAAIACFAVTAGIIGYVLYRNTQ